MADAVRLTELGVQNPARLAFGVAVTDTFFYGVNDLLFIAGL